MNNEYITRQEIFDLANTTSEIRNLILSTQVKGSYNDVCIIAGTYGAIEFAINYLSEKYGVDGSDLIYDKEFQPVIMKELREITSAFQTSLQYPYENYLVNKQFAYELLDSKAKEVTDYIYSKGYIQENNHDIERQI